MTVIDLDATRGTRDRVDEADFVIIGTGAAGATAARVLSEAGHDVALIEEGPAPPQAGFRADAYSAFRSYWRDMGFQAARGRAAIPILQGRAVGGTTVVNGAIVHRLPEAVHAGWESDGALDSRLSYDALTRTFETLDRELRVGPAPESVLGRNNGTLRAAVKTLGARGNVTLRNVDGCRGSGRCNQGCPTGRKQSMHRTFVPRAMRAGARVYATCRAERVRFSRGRASGVSARFRHPVTGERGPRLTLHARRAVLVAASAVGTPMLLLRSGVRHPLLGRRFAAHPGTSVMGIFDEPVRMWSGATQGYETTEFLDDDMKMETVGVPLEIGAARMPGFGADLVRRVADFGHVAQWGVQVKARARGRVRRGLFGDTAIHYDLTDEDVSRFRRGVARLIEMMFATGAREVWPGVHGLPARITSADAAAGLADMDDDPRRFHFIAAHLFGTAAMHPDHRRGVVGPDGGVHGVEALHVIDSSVFPSNLGVNPQHSICAIAWRLAAALA